MNIKSTEYLISIKNRKGFIASGVMNVDSYDDNEIIAVTRLGFLRIKGEELHIISLNLEEETLEVGGHFISLEYFEDKGTKLRAKSKGILNKLLR
ncbi:YabP/YqfC family sporulation protein [Desulfonispora thiosulfatigenes]|nr:YabP/YqfC family sporulation protein [Desulfonispora thiosulfatigenes]